MAEICEEVDDLYVPRHISVGSWLIARLSKGIRLGGIDSEFVGKHAADLYPMTEL